MKRGRPPLGTSVENKLTIILPPGQVDFLDRLSLEIRSKTRAKVRRTEIIRTLIAGLMGSGLDLSGLGTEEDIAAADRVDLFEDKAWSPRLSAVGASCR